MEVVTLWHSSRIAGRYGRLQFAVSKLSAGWSSKPFGAA
jgi:hypothetical protein